MKKVLIPIVIIFAIFIACLTVGCNSTTLDKVVGTYMLTTKTEQHIDAEEATDLIAKNGIVCYVVLDGSEKGYYVYGDDDTPVNCKEIRVEYTRSSDDDNKINSVQFYFSLTDTSDFDAYFVNYDNEAKTNRLVFKKPAVRSDVASWSYTENVEFTRISSEASLSVVNNKLGADLKAIPLALANLHGINAVSASFVGDSETDYISPYIYYYYDIDAADGVAKLYYALKSDLVKHEEDLTFSYDLSSADENDKGTVTLGKTVFALTSSYCASRTETTDDKTISFELYRTGDKDITAAIERAINEYNETLPPEEDGKTAKNE